MTQLPAMTRRQVAARLGVSVATVRRMEGTQLFPDVGSDGVRRFERGQVEQVAMTRGAPPAGRPTPEPHSSQPSRAAQDTGELAAAVFAALDGGQHPTGIVVQHRIPPDLVRRLHADWMAMRGLNLHVPQVTQRLVELETRVSALEQQTSWTEERLGMASVGNGGEVLEQMLAQFRRAAR